MNSKLRFILLTLLLTAVHLVQASPCRGFAIFIDSVSNARCTEAVAAYASSVDKQGLDVQTIVVTESVSPDSLRSLIRQMAYAKKTPIEGMVFIGDIPIPMLLDAQHLTSAFKVAQNPKRMERSACPSDRFYDDLSLKFDFISRDEAKPLLYYYSLRADSPQKSSPDLYSGRIKPMACNGKDKYAALNDYLHKVVEIKQRHEPFTEMLFFAGSGYNSESNISRIDEKAAHMEQFPWMKGQRNWLKYMEHKYTVFTKYPLMSAMQNPNLSLALLHHHGSPDKEYINRYPDPRNARDQLESAKFFFRNKIRAAIERGEPRDSACARFAKEYDVPLHWFDNVTDSASVAADSIYDERLDLYLHDFDKYTPNARLVFLDACFNGAFNNDEYVAGAYIFGQGDCVTVIANSVNSLQDKWCDKHLGLLGLGMRAGNFVKYNPYLESHIIGDPTFCFAPPASFKHDINEALHASPSFWRKQLDSPLPVMQSMALWKLHEAGQITPAQVLAKFRSAEAGITRLGALMLLAETGAPEFVEAIELGLDDSYEMVRRMSAVFAGKNGSPSLLPALIKVYANDLKGERVNFQVQNAMQLFPADSLLAELERQRPFRNAYDESESMDKAREAIVNRLSALRFKKDLAELSSENPDARTVKSFIRLLRNNPLHESLPELFNYLYTTSDAEEQKALVEALGWFNLSYRAPEIAAKLKEVSVDTRFPEAVRTEALKTVARLQR